MDLQKLSDMDTLSDNRGGLFYVESIDFDKNQAHLTNGCTYDPDACVYLLDGTIVERNVTMFRE